MTKTFGIRCEDDLHERLKTIGSEKIREVLLSYINGKLKEVTDSTNQLPESPQETNVCIYQCEDKDPFYIWCFSRKIPKGMCEKQKARYAHYNRLCKPLGMKEERKKPQSIAQPENRSTNSVAMRENDEWVKYAREKNSEHLRTTRLPLYPNRQISPSL